jgi:uncharacterized protein
LAQNKSSSKPVSSGLPKKSVYHLLAQDERLFEQLTGFRPSKFQQLLTEVMPQLNIAQRKLDIPNVLLLLALRQRLHLTHQALGAVFNVHPSTVRRILRQAPATVIERLPKKKIRRHVYRSYAKFIHDYPAVVALLDLSETPLPPARSPSETPTLPPALVQLQRLWTKPSDQEARRFVLAYLGVLLLAEIITVFLVPQLGLGLYGVLLIGLMFHASAIFPHRLHQVLLSLILVPLIRIVSLLLTQIEISLVQRYFFSGLALIFCAFMLQRTIGLRWAQVGLRLGRAPGWQLVAVAVGSLLGVLEYLALPPLAIPLRVDFSSVTNFIVTALVILICTGFVEELIFRGIIQHTLSELLDNQGLVLAAALFAMLHMGFYSIIVVVLVFGVGLFFGWVVRRTGSLWGVTLGHGLTNIILLLLLSQQS